MYTGAFSVLALNCSGFSYQTIFQHDQTVISKRNVSVVFSKLATPLTLAYKRNKARFYAPAELVKRAQRCDTSGSDSAEITMCTLVKPPLSH